MSRGPLRLSVHWMWTLRGGAMAIDGCVAWPGEASVRFVAVDQLTPRLRGLDRE